MGCKPSKASQVATGNTACIHNLEPNVSKEVKIEEIADPIPDTGKETDNIGDNAGEKDVEVNATNEEVKGEGELIPEDSPDQCLSSRKDEEVVEGVVESEFISDTAEEAKIEDVDIVAEAETDVSVGEEEEKAEEEKGEPSSADDSVDQEETILEGESNAITTQEKQNEGEGAE